MPPLPTRRSKGHTAPFVNSDISRLANRNRQNEAASTSLWNALSAEEKFENKVRFLCEVFRLGSRRHWTRPAHPKSEVASTVLVQCDPAYCENLDYISFGLGLNYIYTYHPRNKDVYYRGKWFDGEKMSDEAPLLIRGSSFVGTAFSKGIIFGRTTNDILLKVAEIVDDYERMKQEEHEANLRRKKRAVKLEKEVIKVEPASPASPDFSIAPISPYVDIKEEDFSDDEHIKASITPVHFSIEDFSDDENIFPSKPLSTFWKRSPSQPIKRELEEADFPDFKKIKQEPPD